MEHDEKQKMVVFGLDCATPELLFNKFKPFLPNLSKLMNSGSYGVLKSTVPPLTVPAWASMTTGKDPGELGVYGFQNRKDYSYNDLVIANNFSIKSKRVWDVLNENGLSCIVVGVPQTFPPKISDGIIVSGFMTPSTELEYTYPNEYKKKIADIVQDYKLDVDNFRIKNKTKLFQEIEDMTKKRFKLIRHMIKHEKWDFLMMVEIGLDRVFHAFLNFFEENNENEFQNVVLEYHKLLDAEIGETLKILDKNTIVVVVSDHGAKKMKASICINDWLITEGYLKLKKPVDGIMPLKLDMVDWENTMAWGSGGYFGKVFLNVKKREPKGVIPESDYNLMRDEISEKIKNITDEDGGQLDTKIFYPEKTYNEVNGIPPDIFVYFDDLSFRSVGTVGHEKIWVYESGDASDTSSHSSIGVFIYNDPSKKGDGKLSDLDITNIFKIILNAYGISCGNDGILVQENNNGG
jgi:predicted AlkP superfamily phosphohydrolase/phosphomutase